MVIPTLVFSNFPIWNESRLTDESREIITNVMHCFLVTNLYSNFAIFYNYLTSLLVSAFSGEKYKYYEESHENSAASKEVGLNVNAEKNVPSHIHVFRAEDGDLKMDAICFS
jgi:hypothetical protein